MWKCPPVLDIFLCVLVSEPSYVCLCVCVCPKFISGFSELNYRWPLGVWLLHVQPCVSPIWLTAWRRRRGGRQWRMDVICLSCQAQPWGHIICRQKERKKETKKDWKNEKKRLKQTERELKAKKNLFLAQIQSLLKNKYFKRFFFFNLSIGWFVKYWNYFYFISL